MGVCHFSCARTVARSHMVPWSMSPNEVFEVLETSVVNLTVAAIRSVSVWFFSSVVPLYFLCFYLRVDPIRAEPHVFGSAHRLTRRDDVPSFRTNATPPPSLRHALSPHWITEYSQDHPPSCPSSYGVICERKTFTRPDRFRNGLMKANLLLLHPLIRSQTGKTTLATVQGSVVSVAPIQGVTPVHALSCIISFSCA